MTPNSEDTSYRLSVEGQVQMLRRLMLYWDGQWFLKAVDTFGLDAAVDLNARVRASFGRIEMRLLLKAVGKAQAAGLADAMRLLDLYIQAFLGNTIRAEFVAVGERQSQVIVRRCPAYEGAKLAGLPRQDQSCVACEGLWSAWLETLLPGAQLTVDSPLRIGQGDPLCSFIITISGGRPMFIAKDYDLHLEAPGCEPGAEYWNATATFREDLSPAFPYLNALWKDAIYNVPAQQITWRFGGRAVALKATEITISNLPDRDTATIELEKIIAEINRIWMDREKLEPLYTPRKRLVAMEVFQLLPGTNCKACGQASCFGFATKLTVGEVRVHDCTPLFAEEQYAGKRQALLAMLEEAV